MTVAEQYIAAFSNLAKETNTVLLPSNSGDISGMVSQVCSITFHLSVLILQLAMVWYLYKSSLRMFHYCLDVSNNKRSMCAYTSEYCPPTVAMLNAVHELLCE